MAVLKKCMVCSLEFYVKPYRAIKPSTKYCSRSCLAKIHLAQYAHKRFQPTGKPKRKYKVISVEKKQVRLHRYLMEQHLGRKLETWEHVHHINDDPSDNRIDNLKVLSNSDHQKVESALRRPTC